MSHQMVEAVLRYSQSRHATRLVAIVLAHCTNAKTGACYPSLPYIAERAQITPRQVRRCLRELESTGELKSIRGGRGPKSTSHYCLSYPQASETAARPPEAGQMVSLRRTERTENEDKRSLDGGLLSPLNRQIRQEEKIKQLESDRSKGPLSQPPTADPEAVRFEIMRAQKRRNLHGAVPVDAGSAIPGGRILESRRPPSDFQRNLALLLGVPTLERDDAYQLASLAPFHCFKEAMAEFEKQRGKITNPGGWFRSAVTGWVPARLGDKPAIDS